MKRFYRHPWLIVAVIFVITVFFALQLPRAELDNNNLRFVPDNDPALETSRRIDDMFGSSLFVLIGLERQYGTVFDGVFLNRIRSYAQTIQEIPIVRDVTSLINTDYISAEGDAIVVTKLVGDDFSGTPEEIAELKRRVLSWDMYERSLVSDDFSATQILVSLNIASQDAGRGEITADIVKIRDTARLMFSGMATVYVTGMPIISATVNEAMNADLVLLVPLVIVIVLAVLFFSFRGFTPVALPLLTVVIAAVWSMGAMPLFGVKLSVISTVLPVILVAVGSAYGIHVITHYLNGRGSAEMSREEHRELVFDIVRKIRKPVFLAALTTFAAFVSFCFTSVVPIREFGFFSSFGVASAFAAAITLIPALLLIRGPRPMSGPLSQKGAPRNSGGGVQLADTLTSIARKKKTIIFLTCVVLAFSIYGFSKIIIDNVMVEYFRSDTDIYKSDSFIRRQFGGSKVVSIVLEADSPEITLHPDTLAAMDGLSRYLRDKVPNTGKILGFTDLIKRINQVFNADESPDGLRSPARAEPAGGDFGFGDFGGEVADAAATSDFGFGFGDFSGEAADTDAAGDFGFGFGDFSGDEEPAVQSAPVVAEQEPDAAAETETAVGEKLFTQNELVALFEKAGSVSLDMSAAGLVSELKRLVNYEGASYYEIPVDPARYGKQTKEELTRLISNYLVLLSGNISQYSNDPLEPTAIKSMAQFRTVGMHDSYEILDEIDKYVRANFPDNVRVTIGGTTMVESSLNDLVVQSQLVSLVFSIICVFIIIAASNRSLVAGCIGIAPLSISVLINFAVMGFTGIKLNLGTSMVASVSVGVGIDYTIHCLEAYKREYNAGGSTNFLWRTFISSGKAIIINALSVGAGFAVLLLSRFTMLGDLGLLIAITMFSSALVSLTVLPALLLLFKPKFIYRERSVL